MRARLAALLLLPALAAAQVPPAALAHRAELARSAYRTFGPDAPVATLAGQVQQESAWRPEARSHAGAEGLTQFMPLTARDMAERYPADCAPANPYSPRWALRCRDHYMHSQLRALRPMGNGLDECARWTFALRGYNGGAGWVQWDRELALRNGADPDDWMQVQPHRGFNPRTGARRTDANHRENIEYAPRIYRAQQRYLSWGRAVCTEIDP